MSSITNAYESPSVTTPELANYLGLSVSTLRRWRYQGYGPKPVIFGQHTVRYRMKDVEAFVISCPTTSTSCPGAGS